MEQLEFREAKKKKKKRKKEEERTIQSSLIRRLPHHRQKTVHRQTPLYVVGTKEKDVDNDIDTGAFVPR